MRIISFFAGMVRITAGGLWVHEGYIKYHAGFGSNDILLVSSSVASNPRTAEWYVYFTTIVLGNFTGLLGVLIPLLEVGIGVALIIGMFILPSALVSVGLLTTYWLADQLTDVYPVLLLFSVVVILCRTDASRYSMTTLLLRSRMTLAASKARAWL